MNDLFDDITETTSEVVTFSRVVSNDKSSDGKIGNLGIPLKTLSFNKAYTFLESDCYAKISKAGRGKYNIIFEYSQFGKDNQEYNDLSEDELAEIGTRRYNAGNDFVMD